MVRILLVLWLMVGLAHAQTTEVDPADLQISVTIETTQTAPYQNEMVLLTVHGVYKRYITLEKLEQPDLAGFNWMQLGEDYWFDSTINGIKVKNMRRRMALFPDKSGRLEIGPFVHHLTLLDEENKWFAYDIQSEPVVLEVKPAPDTADWWFPVRGLTISDDWSNAPDQLKEGEGVLRIVRLNSLGVAPEMVPPMPELTSPSAHIFPHPVKHLVELTPDGPETVTFWRWTIKPRNPPSAILEPIELTYFDTVAREMRSVKISAQKVSMEQIDTPPPRDETIVPAQLHTGLLASTASLALLCGVVLALGRGRAFSVSGIRRVWVQSLLNVRFYLTSDLRELRKTAHALSPDQGRSDAANAILGELDAAIFGRESRPFSASDFKRRFRRALTAQSHG